MSNGSSGPALTYSNLGNLAGGNLQWEEPRPVVQTSVVEHRSNREEQRKPQITPSEQQSYQQQIHRSGRPEELTNLVEAMNNLRAREFYKILLKVPTDLFA